jgi:UDP-N-acetylglucosamine transferase subunit ALG13
MTRQSGQSARILATVGTDHHPFDRLIGWVNSWLASHQEMAAGCFVQYGTSPLRPVCAGSQFLAVDALATLLDEADVIVCHGGPASISEAWARQRIPIVVPRLSKLGEHVDDHQAEFCEKIAGLGRVAVAWTLPEFVELMDGAAANPERFRTRGPSAAVDEAVAKFGDLVEELVSRPRGARFMRQGTHGRRVQPARGTGGLGGDGRLPGLAGQRLPASANEEQE